MCAEPFFLEFDQFTHHIAFIYFFKFHVRKRSSEFQSSSELLITETYRGQSNPKIIMRT